MPTFRFLSRSRWSFVIGLLAIQSVNYCDVYAKTLFEFSGRSDQRSRFGFDAPESFNASNGFGKFSYRSVGADSDPNPRVGSYDVIIEDFQLDFAGDRLSISEIAAVATVKDNYGCDCFFIDIPHSGIFAGQSFDRLFVNIQNEFGPEAFTMFDDDSLPLDGLNVPFGSWITLMFYMGNDLTIFEISQGSIVVSLVPEPSPVCLLFLAIATSLGGPMRLRAGGK